MLIFFIIEYQQAAKKDLEEAEPAIAAAVAALNTLDKNNLTELKSFPKPLKEVVEISFNSGSSAIFECTHIRLIVERYAQPC